MECYTELIAPTAVTHSLALPFLTPDANNLIVVKTSLLQVFALHNAQSKLVLIGEYPLAGTVTSIARLKTLGTRTGGEAILLAFKNAKLSLIEWDPENHRISTVSIHYYEGENVIAQPYGPSLGEYESILTVDPGSRCAALKFGARQLAILPFRQFGDELLGEEEGEFENANDGTTSKRQDAMQNGEDEAEQTPYKQSFVLPLTTPDPALSHTIDLAFLHEYREPTFGIISSAIEPSYALFDERKDILTYTVFTLDLEQKASTNLITVPNLPSNLWKVVPLPSPIGGALLIGTNEFIHVDQSGKANATAVNEFAMKESDFGMADQSGLNLKLEGCSVEILNSSTGEMLVVLRDGPLATVDFKMLGRSISAVIVTIVSSDSGGKVFSTAPSCVSRLDPNHLFIGSEDGSSSLLGCADSQSGLSRKRSHAQMLGQNSGDEEEDVLDEDDDDLYDAEPDSKKRATSVAEQSAGESSTHFEIKDDLHSIGPINNTCVGRSNAAGEDKLQLLAGTGKSRSSRLTCINRDIIPQHVRKNQFEGAKHAWAVCAREKKSDDVQPDNMLFVHNGSRTKVYDITSANDDEAGEGGYTERSATEFEHDGETLEVLTLGHGAAIVQVRRMEIRTYDSHLALSQIIPMIDDETDAEFSIVHTSACDPYLLVIRDDSSIQVLQHERKDIEPLDITAEAADKKWMSGCVYSGEFTDGNAALFLLSAEGSLHVFTLPDMQLVYTTPALPHLPPVLSADVSHRRMGVKETLTELLVADLGSDGILQPYLMVRTAMDDVVLYEPFHFSPSASTGPWHSNLRFRKVPVPYIPKYNDSPLEDPNARPPALRRMRIGRYDTVSIPGAPSCLLLKEASGPPKILEVNEPNKTNTTTILTPLNRVGCEDGFATVDVHGALHECQLHPDAWFSTGWSIRQIDLGDDAREVRHLAYHEARGMFVAATCTMVDFYFAEEDGRHPEQDDISIRPQVPQYSVHLISAKTHKIIHTHKLPYLETVTALKVMPAEVSELSHEVKPVVVVSTGAQRGEDMPAKGALIVFDVIDVVPDPDVEESGLHLHVLAREESRGAITALASFPGGMIGTAQGLKLMIRGMREDGSCLPVAFLDAQCYTSLLKTLDSRGLWLAGDAWKGLWFGGFTQEPYKLTLLGKSPRTEMEVIEADFLPFDGALFLLVLDADADLHVLQYDPENPKSLNGQRLLHRSTFHIGHFPTGSMLLPSTLAPFTEQARDLPNGDSDDTKQEEVNSPLFHVLTTTSSGSIGLITPLDESTYHRLSALQGHLTNILEHAAGLNPRMYRTDTEMKATDSEMGGAKGVVDGSLIRRISELGAARRADILSRVGGDVWQLRSDLEVCGGGGLGYL
ncbi:Cleavage/polyadenylation specificity factor A subunit like protein [Zymoseptoria brevis]|uniref:Cleavage/polyadenylation specificity factor A subunit like protein n=1 Tax=Zymoseptoria brevis TaxID=1047168 RepID=A0A0F4G854_9PEZI|nr:Cleavage/polyadenylation specificity factor A subunit like protein [Zymoseptoria brevis]